MLAARRAAHRQRGGQQASHLQAALRALRRPALAGHELLAHLQAAHHAPRPQARQPAHRLQRDAQGAPHMYMYIYIYIYL